MFPVVLVLNCQTFRTILRRKIFARKMSSTKFAVDPKYNGLETNIWIEINTLKDELVDCVNLGQGFPDYQPSPEIVKHLAKVCLPDPELHALHQYARAYGHPRLVKALSAMYSHLVGVQIDPWNEVLVTGGAYGALFYTIMSNVGKGDEVIIIEPFFDCYEPMVLLAGGTPVFTSLKPKDTSNKLSTSSKEWSLDMKHFSSLFNSKTKALILNSPNNPLGKMFSKEELQAIADLCIKHDVLVISDEVYEWLTYEEEHIRICTLPGMWERTVTIGSAGKTFSLTGWKLGWAYGPSNLIRNLQIAHQNCTYMCHTPEQEAVAAALEEELKNILEKKEKASYFHRMRKELSTRRDILMKAICDAGMTPILPQGGYFILANWSALKPSIDEKELEKQGQNLSPVFSSCEDVRFCIWLAKQKKIVGVPPSAFYSAPNKYLAKDYIRFNFYKKLDTLEKGSQLLRSVQKKN